MEIPHTFESIKNFLKLSKAVQQWVLLFILWRQRLLDHGVHFPGKEEDFRLLSEPHFNFTVRGHCTDTKLLIKKDHMLLFFFWPKSQDKPSQARVKLSQARPGYSILSNKQRTTTQKDNQRSVVCYEVDSWIIIYLKASTAECCLFQLRLEFAATSRDQSPSSSISLS